jgi:hypothetical protein
MTTCDVDEFPTECDDDRPHITFGSVPEARRYVYRVLVLMLDSQIQKQDTWMFGGVIRTVDRTRVTKAIRAVQAELRKKSRRP